jgi:glycosyltransferase involved in cell wall biosynthesis
MHYAVPAVLSDAGLLGTMFTDAYVGNKKLLGTSLRWFGGLTDNGAIRRANGRENTAIAAERVISFDMLGVSSALRRRNAKTQLERDQVSATLAQRFCELILRSKERKAKRIWGFNTASLELFDALKPMGVECILEQTIVPKILEQEMVPLRNSSTQLSPLVEREIREWALADKIVTGSEYVKQALLREGVTESKIQVIPYGVDEGQFRPVGKLPFAGRKIRALFVGQIGYRKGVYELEKALPDIDSQDWELRMAGSIVLDDVALLEADTRVSLLGAVPRNEINELFEWADFLVLPSLAEGSATVTYEALSAGIPVITTPNAGSLVEHGVDGMVVPAGDASSLARAMNSYLNDAAILQLHQQNAKAGRMKASLSRYRSDILNFLE